MFGLLVLLMILWVLGLVTSATLGGFLNLVLVVAVISIVLHFVFGRRRLAYGYLWRSSGPRRVRRVLRRGARDRDAVPQQSVCVQSRRDVNGPVEQAVHPLVRQDVHTEHVDAAPADAEVDARSAPEVERTDHGIVGSTPSINSSTSAPVGSGLS